MTLVVDVRVLTETLGSGASLAQSLGGAALLAEAVQAAAGAHGLLFLGRKKCKFTKKYALFFHHICIFLQ